METQIKSIESSPRDLAKELVDQLSGLDFEVQNSTIEYIIKGISTDRTRQIEKLEHQVMQLRDANHDLTTRLAYINHSKA